MNDYESTMNLAEKEDQGHPPKVSSAWWKKYSPGNILTITIISIALSEVTAMILIRRMGVLPYTVQTILDAFIMTVLIFPVIFLFVYRPLQSQINLLSDTEQSLRKANQTVNDERQRLYSLFDQLPAFVYLCDYDYHIRYANSNFVKLFGDYQGKVCYNLITNCDKPCGSCLDPHAESAQELFETEWVSPEGKYYRIYHYPFTDYDGASLLLKLGIDITEHRKSELALVSANELLERMFFDEHIHIAFLDRNFDFLRVNHTYARADGHEPDYYVGKNHFELFPHAENEQIFRKVFETGQPYVVYEKPFEYPKNPERGVTYWDWSLQPVRNASGEVDGMVLSLMDVTERRRAEAESKLERSKLKSILDSMQDGVYISNQNYRIEYANPAIRREYGAEDQSPCYTYLHNRTEICPWCVNQRYPAGKSLSREWTSPTSSKVYDVVDTILPNPDGSTSKLEMRHDITVRKQGEKRLGQAYLELQKSTQAERQQRQLAEALIETSSALNKSLDLDEVLKRILIQIQRVIPFRAAFIILAEGEKATVIRQLGFDGYMPELQNLTQGFILNLFPPLETAKNTLQPILVKDIYDDNSLGLMPVNWLRSYMIVPLDSGGQFHSLITLMSDQSGFFSEEDLSRVIGFAGNTHAAIRNAWLYEQVRESRERLQSLSRRLVDLQEQERRFISRELHDEAGQALTSLIVDLRLLERQASDPEAVLAKVASMEQSLDEVINNLHRLAMDLRPASLDHVGLIAAVKQNVENIGQKNNLQTRFKAHGTYRRLPADVETNLYRIIQEALTNVLRHACATGVDVTIHTRENELVAIVEDNGKGFDPESHIKTDRLGLVGMRERAEMVGGRLTVESMPDKGTTIYVEVPYDNPNPGRR